MKTAKKLFLGIILTAFTAVSFGATATAAGNDGKVIEVEIPFEFYVKNDKLAAGKYEIQKLSDRLIALRNPETGQRTLILANFIAPNKKILKDERLVFNRYGGETFLREIYINRTADGHGLDESKTEKQIRKNLEEENNLARGARPETVSVKATK